MSRICHIVLPCLLALLLSSCVGRPRIIPRATLTDIYSEMFLADQWLADHREERTRADTMLFYDPIISRYGYTFEDYDASVRHYLKDPEKFAKVFRDAANKLKDKRDVYRRKVEHLEKVKEFNAAIKGYSVKDFKKDTIIWRTRYKDSLLVALADSVRRDSIIRDSLRLDSLRRDSLRLDSLRRDSIRVHGRSLRVVGRKRITAKPIN